MEKKKDNIIKNSEWLIQANFERLMKEQENNPDDDPSAFKHQRKIKR